MRLAAVIQARVGSSRLPGKVLEPIGHRPMIAHVLDRASRIAGVDEVAAALPDLPEDDALADIVQSLGYRVVRGSGPDVLQRYLKAADEIGADAVVRITADCPLLSPMVSGRVVRAFRDGGADYASNTLARTYPRGLDTEVVSVAALRTANTEADPVEREHVTPYVYRRPQSFSLRSVELGGGRNLSSERWTVDTPADLRFVRRVVDELGPTDALEWEGILDLLERHPEIGDINRDVTQKPIER